MLSEFKNQNMRKRLLLLPFAVLIGLFSLFAQTSSSKDTKKTPIYDVLYKSDKPKLDVQEPSDNTKTNKEDVKISGVTDKETTIRVNGQPLIVDVDGKFTTMLRLKDGENKIQITAEDIVGNQEVKNLTVTYSKDE